MKTTINKEFFDRWVDERVVMWCKKEEYAKEFCKILDKYGFKWNYGNNYIDDNNWVVYEQDTCYNFNKGSYMDFVFYKHNNYKILDFENYIVDEEKEELNNPTHYQINGQDTMQLIISLVKEIAETKEEAIYLFNIFKYLIRHKKKNKIKDLEKAKDYLNRLIECEVQE